MAQFKLHQLVVGMGMTNCYLLLNEQTRELFIVDPGDNAGSIIRKIDTLQAKPVAIVLTHGHYDHTMAVKEVKEQYKIPVYAGELETDLLRDVTLNHSGLRGRPVSIVPDVLLLDGETFSLAGLELEVLHTPGHTAGSICCYSKELSLLFSGDTLFYESIGRTDLPTGNMHQMEKSLKKLLTELPEDTTVLPGHGDRTSIEHELRYNPFV
ncbi:MAG: MBL fold metallo-hydrolase [Lachnospiraceae bacterium]